MLLSWHLQALLGVTLLAAILRFSTLGTQSYWYDEAITVGLVRRPFHGMLSAIPHSESSPPLYYLLAWGWSKLFGTGEAGLRSLSALFGTATVPAAYVAARALISARTGLITAAFIAVSPFLIWFSQEARAYALLVFLGTLSLGFFGHALARNATRPLTWWAIVSSLAMATHYFAVFLVAAEGAWLLYRFPDRRAVARVLGILALAAAALTPLAVYQAHDYRRTSWIPNSVSLGGRAAYVLHQFVVGAYPVSHIQPIVIAVPVVVLIGLFVWTEPRERNGGLLALGLGVAALGAPFGLALVGDLFLGGRGDYFIFRNVIVAAVPLTIAAAAITGARRAGWRGSVAAALACLLLVAISIDISRRPDLQRPDARGVAAALGFSAGPRAIVLEPRYLPLKLYRPDLRDLGTGRARVTEIDLVDESTDPTAQSGFPLPPGFHQVEISHVQAFTIVRVRAARPRLVTRSSLAREMPGRELAILVDPAKS